MKIINFLLICSIFFCNNLFSAETERVTISCEGTLYQKYTSSKADESKFFHQDLEVLLVSGQIYWVTILDSSIWYSMKENYGEYTKKSDAEIMGKLTISDDQKIIKYHSNPNLVLPHPEMSKRNFVLLPLFELSKSWKHPISKFGIVKLINLLNINDLRTIKQV